MNDSDQKVGVETQILISYLDKQFDYGKWYLASIIAADLGSLYVISATEIELARRLLDGCGILLILSLAAAICAGGIGWISFSAGSLAQGQRVRSLLEGQQFAPARWLVRASMIALIIGSLAALASLGLFLAATWRALAIL